MEIMKRAFEIGILRGDLNLVKTAFDSLWGSDPVGLTRHWLRWQLPMITLKVAYYLIGEWSAAYQSMGSANTPEEEKTWRQFAYKLALGPKNLDALALFMLARKWGDTYPEEKKLIDLELSRTWYYLNQANKKSIEVAVDDLAEILLRQNGQPGFLNPNRDDYIAGIIRYLSEAVKRIGTRNNKETMLAAMILFGRRSASQEEIQAVWKESIRKREKVKPVKIDLPWYVYDPYTDAGQAAIEKFCEKNTKFTQDQIKRLWLFFETFKIGKKDCLFTTNDPGIAESYWWIPCIKHNIDFGDSPRSLLMQWKKISKRLEELIEKPAGKVKQKRH